MRSDRARRWLRLSLVIVPLAIGASLAGILVDDVYAEETRDWRNQALAQDWVNLALIYPTLAACALRALAGSARAYAVWLGLIAYTAYGYAIYAFDIHFGALFPVYVALFGLGVWCLAGGLLALEPRPADARGAVFPARVLMGVGAAFYVLWIGDVTSGVLSGETPAATEKAGLVTNPVHVLDMALLLPSAIAVGLGLRRGSALARSLAPVVLVCFLGLSGVIVGAVVVAEVRGDEAGWAIVGPIALLAVALGSALRRTLPARAG